ncbi:MAG TPA: copper-containing nitrite reductase [Candidatus Dormibacteraeota bacterium]|nr:copper-containing nitrite reductase [Candidatus Dormibacteraeota bacterium]
MKIRLHLQISFVKATISTLLFLFSITGALAAQEITHGGHQTKANTKVVDIVRDPSDIPPTVGNRKPSVVQVTLTAEEVVGTLDPSVGTTYRYWTFNGKVPGPMIRVRQGDTVEVTLRNDASSHMAHSVDLHAALGPGGGAAFTQAIPGQSKTFTFQATTPGLFVYHCGTPMIAEHIANGMYGLILVEPEGGLAAVDHEYYVMQGEIYTTVAKGKAGMQQFSDAKLMEESPEYFVFNGAVDALTKTHPMQAKVGETVRVFFGDAGPNDTSSLHVVGEIFTRDYLLGSLTSPPLTSIQTASVPPGAAAILEFKASVPGQFAMMDHAMARMAKGLMATFQISGAENAALMHPGPASDSIALGSPRISGMTQADTVSSLRTVEGAPTAATASTAETVPPDSGSEMSMPAMMAHTAKPGQAHAAGHAHGPVATEAEPSLTELNGCLTLANDGKAMLQLLQSSKVYRMEARPLLFSQNANRLVHVTGYFGSVVEVEDPHVRSFVVDTLDALAPNCSLKLSAATIRKTLAKLTAPVAQGTVGMTDMGFVPAAITVNAGDKVVWKNSSPVIHNVVDDASKALSVVDVKLPSGARPFDSGLLQPGQSFSRVFTEPGIYRYVCTLHEGSGMKGVVIVRPSPLLAAHR